ncbi:YdcF family protein [Rossellomorea vietnamensis]|uniref:YdcF family protein n=1 Tax=Rossellomorea vietnamensis TaxID=218284 RepID=A0A5D4KLS3_9BACI|nr:YdcF family protein [Rossellomorea vietnamensis]
MKLKTLRSIFMSALILLILFILIFGVTFGILFIIANFIFVVFLYFISQKLGSKWLRIIQRTALVAYGLFFVSFGAVQIMLMLEAGREIPDDIDYAVILGAGLKGEELSETLKSRLEAGADYLQEHPEVPVIVSGGQGEGEDIPESTAMFRYLTSHGISEDRITEENQSTTTWENLRNSKAILESKGEEDGKILIITSDYHVFRATLTGKQLGLDSSGLAGESGFFIKINYMIREYFAVVKTVFIGGE